MTAIIRIVILLTIFSTIAIVKALVNHDILCKPKIFYCNCSIEKCQK